MYDMLLRGKEGNRNAYNGSASEEVIHGVSEDRVDPDVVLKAGMNRDTAAGHIASSQLPSERVVVQDWRAEP
jgi:hypothetical protein